MNSKYTVGFDIYDNKPLTKGIFVIWNKEVNAPHKIIETRFVKLWLLWFKLKGFKVLKETNDANSKDTQYTLPYLHKRQES